MPPNFNSPQITVDAYLKNPDIIRRELTSLVTKRFVADRIFAQGSAEQVKGGIARYQMSESIYPDAAGSDVEEIGLRAEYPRFGWTEALQEAYVRDFGLEFVINDKARRRNQIDLIPRGMIKQANALVRFVDTLAMNTILAASTQTMSASGDWTTAATDIVKDVVRAKKLVNVYEEGYRADMAVINDDQYEDLLNDADVRASMPRETNASFVQTGEMPPFMGLTWIPTSRLAAGTILVLNSKICGTIADEAPLADEGYVAEQPGDPSQAPIWVKQYREEHSRDTIITAARWPAMWVAEPKAIVKITGA